MTEEQLDYQHSPSDGPVAALHILCEAAGLVP